MLAQLINNIKAVLSVLPFSSAEWFVIFVIAFVVWTIHKASKDPKTAINWTDILLDDKTNKMCPYRLGYLIGSIVSTWVIIVLVQKATLTADLFFCYLGFLVGGVGMSKFGRRSDNSNNNNGS